MQWSKLKKNIESFFADSVKGRVELRSVRYNKTHDNEGRGYITIDKEEIASFCTISTWNKEYEIATELRNISGSTDFRNPEHQVEYYQAYEQADDITKKQGLHSQYDFYNSLNEYLSLSIDEALESNNDLIKALTILDRRLGKRRVAQLKGHYSHPEFLSKLFQFRCKVDNVRIAT
ncbi:hypothetical protein [Pseudoalteromonas phenolica]|uniref:SF0329 family protein n=1 Tax=Pseudoalteromonas phenolica TaxID=161398 RepID=UPI00384CA3AF